MSNPKITRTLFGYIYNVKALNDECNVVERAYKLPACYSLEDEEQYSKAIRTLRKIDNSIAKIISVTEVNELYAMSESEFLAKAEIVTADNRRDKVTKTITAYNYKCIALDDECNVIEKFHAMRDGFSLEDKEEYNKAIKALRKIDNSIAKIVSVEKIENIYGIDEATFYSLAEYIPEGRNATK